MRDGAESDFMQFSRREEFRDWLLSIASQVPEFGWCLVKRADQTQSSQAKHWKRRSALVGLTEN